MSGTSSGDTTERSRRRIQNRWLPVGALVVAAVIRAVFNTPEHEADWIRIGIPTLAIALLLPTVLATLHHAEAAAGRLGEPFGTLLLTLAVTTIEVALIISVMFNGENNPTLAREAVFSVVMMTCTGGVGVCLVLGALRHREQDLNPQATNAYLAVLMALSVLSLILPDFTVTTAPGTYTAPQLGFVSLLSLLLYIAFLYIQSVRHRSDFVEPSAHGEHPSVGGAVDPLWISVACLMGGLVAVVLLGERFAIGVEDGLAALGVQRPDALIGALIAALLLFPEMLAAIRAARANQLQRSLNVILGSALATIGLTIPAVAIVSLVTGRELTLGLVDRDEVLLVLAMGLSIVSFGTGRTNVLTGLVHLVVWFAYLMLLFVP